MKHKMTYSSTGAWPKIGLIGEYWNPQRVEVQRRGRGYKNGNYTGVVDINGERVPVVASIADYNNKPFWQVIV